MHNLGYTRSSWQVDHALLTPDTFIRASLPGMKKATAIVHAAPAMGAAFTEYTVEFEADGRIGPSQNQRFLYVLEGTVDVAGKQKKHRLSKDGYAYLPPGDHTVSAREISRAIVIEKEYVPLKGTHPPKLFIGSEPAIPGQPLLGDTTLEVRTLVPADMAFDFAVNTLTFQPGASLPMVEVHVMEHGLLMLEGGGIYRLGESWYQAVAGDFIWMGPYCPQWFGALGKVPSKYLLYKDWNRHPLAR